MIAVLQPSSEVLPSFTTPHSHTLLPVEDVRRPTDIGQPHAAPAAPAAGQPAAHPHPPRQPPQQEALPPGYASQPLPAVHGGVGAGSFSFFRSMSGRRRGGSNDAPFLVGREESVVGDRATGSGSGSHRSNSSSGRLPALLQNLGSSLRHSGSVASRDASFDSRGASWSTRREDSQSGGGLGDHVWFV